MERFLAGTDFSSRATHAVERAAALAGAGGELALLHVLPPAVQIAGALSPDEALALQRELMLEASVRLGTLAERLHGRFGVNALSFVRTGAPFHEVVQAARERESRLVVLGAQGAGFIGRLVLGTTSAKVVRKGDRPVLVVRRSGVAPYRHILAGVDFSPESEGAVRFAATLFPGAGFLLMHVHDAWYLERLRSDVGAGGTERYLVELRAELLRQLREFAATVGLGRDDCRYSVVFGHPGVALAAAGARANLTVVGNRGAGGLAEVLLGTTSEHVLRESRGDVLVVR